MKTSDDKCDWCNREQVLVGVAGWQESSGDRGNTTADKTENTKSGTKHKDHKTN